MRWLRVARVFLLGGSFARGGEVLEGFGGCLFGVGDGWLVPGASPAKRSGFVG